MDKNEKRARMMVMLLGMMIPAPKCQSCGLYGDPMVCPKCGRKVCSTCISVQKDMCINCDEVVGLKPLDEDVSDT